MFLCFDYKANCYIRPDNGPAKSWFPPLALPSSAPFFYWREIIVNVHIVPILQCRIILLRFREENKYFNNDNAAPCCCNNYYSFLNIFTVYQKFKGTLLRDRPISLELTLKKIHFRGFIDPPRKSCLLSQRH
jgi:hypothetical protein